MMLVKELVKEAYHLYRISEKNKIKGAPHTATVFNDNLYSFLSPSLLRQFNLVRINAVKTSFGSIPRSSHSFRCHSSDRADTARRQGVALSACVVRRTGCVSRGRGVATFTASGIRRLSMDRK